MITVWAITSIQLKKPIVIPPSCFHSYNKASYGLQYTKFATSLPKQFSRRRKI